MIKRLHLKESLAKGGRIVAATASIALAAASPHAASAQEFDLTMGAIVSSGDIYTHLTQSIPQRIAEATDGRVAITVSDSLVAPNQIASAVRDGRLPMSAALHTYLAGDEPRMGIFNLPGLIESITEYQQVREAFWAEDVEQIWDETWNAKVLAEGAWCYTRLFSKTPIHAIDDFQGKRLRVHNPQTAALVGSLGGQGTPMAMTEITPALERGVIDGVFTSACVGGAMEIWREAPHVQDWGIGPVTGWAILVNNEVWESLPSEVQEQIQGAMSELEAEAFGDYEAFVAQAEARMEEGGAHLWVASPELRAELNQPRYTDAAFETWHNRARELGFDGPEYVQKIREALGK